MSGERTAGYRFAVRGLLLRDIPKLAWIRLTVCRKHGHHYGRDTDYCMNCGAPWIIRAAPHHDSEASE